MGATGVRRWAARLLVLAAALAVAATSSPPSTNLDDSDDVRITLTDDRPAAKLEVVTTLGAALHDLDVEDPPQLELHVGDDASAAGEPGSGLFVRTLVTPLGAGGAPLGDPVDVVAVLQRDPRAHCDQGACTQRYRVRLARQGRGGPVEVQLEARLAAEYEVYELPAGDTRFTVSVTEVGDA